MLILIGIACVLGVYYQKDLQVRKSHLENEIIEFKVQGKVVGSLSMKELMARELMTFNAHLKSNGKQAVEHTYEGLLLKDVIEEAGMSLAEAEAILAKAVDGYTSAISIDKILEDDNVYLAIKRDGDFLKDRDAGGDGPFQIIISKDPFSQYWCKWVIEVDIQ